MQHIQTMLVDTKPAEMTTLSLLDPMSFPKLAPRALEELDNQLTKQPLGCCLCWTPTNILNVL